MLNALHSLSDHKLTEQVLLLSLIIEKETEVWRLSNLPTIIQLTAKSLNSGPLILLTALLPQKTRAGSLVSPLKSGQSVKFSEWWSNIQCACF